MSTISQTSRIQLPLPPLATGAPTLSMQEFPQENNARILQDNPCSSNTNSLLTPLLKTSEVESTSNVQAFVPFWNNSSKEISKELWSPTLTDSPDSVLTSFNGCLHSSEPYWTLWRHQNQSQEKNLWKTSWKFSPSLQPDTTGLENTSNLVTRKIKLHPTQAQKCFFQKCLQHHRYFYNKTISKINETYKARKAEFEASVTCVHCTEPKAEGSFCCAKHQSKALPWKISTSFYTLRSQILQSDEDVKDDPAKAWQAETPYDTRQMAIQEAVSALKAALTNKKRGNISQFELGYKSRRSPKQVFCVNDNAIKKVTKPEKKKCKKGKKCKTQPVSSHAWLQMFPTRLGKEKYVRVRKRAMKRLPDVFARDCKIMKYGKEYYLLYVYEKLKIPSAPKTDDLVALDPGVRTFQTGYSPSGIALKCGHRQHDVLRALHGRLDALRSLRAKASVKRKQRLRKACLRVEHKLHNTIENLHNQTASFLAKTFQTVLLPKFRTSVMQKGTTLSRRTKRDLWSLSHYAFQQKLLGLCNWHGTTLYLVEEDFTTKTCGGCGILLDVGKAKLVLCKECGYRQDRDVHGARNILLKHLTQFGSV